MEIARNAYSFLSDQPYQSTNVKIKDISREEYGVSKYSIDNVIDNYLLGKREYNISSCY